MIEQPAITATVRALIDQSYRLGLTWKLRPATINSSSPLTAVYDGDSEPIFMVSLIGSVLADTRVMALTVPPSGNFIIGNLTNTAWQAVTAFSGSWGNVGAPWQDAAYRFTLEGTVQLSGLVALTAGTASPPATIFVLPFGYRPIHNHTVAVSNNPSAGTAGTLRALQVLPAGDVQVTNFTAVTNPGPISLEFEFPIDAGVGP